MLFNYIITQLKEPVSIFNNIELLLQKKLGQEYLKIKEYKLLNKSIDARDKNNIMLVFNIQITTTKKIIPKIKGITIKEQIVIKSDPVKKINNPHVIPLIVGMGPAGLFCAIRFIEYGIPVKIIDRGKPVEDRVTDIERLWNKGVLNKESNPLFGEGGAGTFSDGKLNTQVNHPYIQQIKETLVRFGAPEEISYESKPHIGSDKLRIVLINIRKYLKENGCEITFNAKLEDIIVKKNTVDTIIINGKSYNSEHIFLAIGHSAHDTYEMLYNKNFTMEAKPFAIGFRIEHPQELINKIQFGNKFYNNTNLGSSPYKLTYNDKETKRSVFSFCMCPGGTVICASNQEERLVINGMSLYKRDSSYANSAIITSIKPEDYYKNSPLDGINFIKEFEKKAFIAGGKTFKAPAQNIMDYINNSDPVLPINTTYKPGITPYNLNNIYSIEINNIIKKGLNYFEKRMKNFITQEATLTGVETRTSAPLRIIRNKDTYMSKIHGVYPIGEGSGYAGGIMSAALDGYKSVDAYIKNFYHK